MDMYRVAHITTINNMDLPYYKGVRGSNSLEGFHKALPHMIPGTQLQSVYSVTNQTSSKSNIPVVILIPFYGDFQVPTVQHGLIRST